MAEKIEWHDMNPPPPEDMPSNHIYEQDGENEPQKDRPNVIDFSKQKAKREEKGHASLE